MFAFSDVTVGYDDRPVLVDVNLSVAASSRTAVVGVNGAGKSTLLRLAAGVLQPDRGTVTVAPGARVAYVPQDMAVQPAGVATVADFVKHRAGVLDADRTLRRLEQALADADAGQAVALAEAYGEATEAYAALGGWDVEARIDVALDRLGLGAALRDRPLRELSGGQRVRAGLAGVLAARFDAYLLDEPTNDLDLEALGLLEEFVATAEATFLLISHDRAFLDAVVTDVVELDEHTHGATVYGVGFGEYRALREGHRAAALAGAAAYQAEVGRLQTAARAQAARAATTKDRRPRRDNDKFARHFFAQRSAQQAAKAQRSLEQRAARLAPVEEPRTGWALHLSLDAGARSGDLVVEADRVARRLGDFRLGPLSLSVGWGDRLALGGHNGAGKSLLLGLLTGADEPDAGTVRRGPSVRFGVLRQGGADLTGGSGLKVFQRHVAWPQAETRTLLAKFDLGADHVPRPVASYSPGERCRLGLAILMAQGTNCLVLDEPTNHLDLEATEQLEQALAGFTGTLMVVSHDRTFLNRIGITRHLDLAGGQIVHRAQVAGDR